MSVVAVTLYSKPECALCDRLLEDLAWLGEQVPLAVETRDIREDAATEERFRYLIPVLEVDGVLHYPPHDLLGLRRVLEDASRAGVR
jgi:thiol-disulfide isomerase/thioredoxin